MAYSSVRRGPGMSSSTSGALDNFTESQKGQTTFNFDIDLEPFKQKLYEAQQLWKQFLEYVNSDGGAGAAPISPPPQPQQIVEPGKYSAQSVAHRASTMMQEQGNFRRTPQNPTEYVEAQKMMQIQAFYNRQDLKNINEKKEAWDKTASSLTRVSFTAFLAQNALKNLGVENKKVTGFFDKFTSVVTIASSVVAVLTLANDMLAMSKRNTARATQEAIATQMMETSVTKSATAADAAQLTVKTAANPLLLPLSIAAGALILAAIGTWMAKSKAFHTGGTVSRSGRYELEEGERIRTERESRFDNDMRPIQIQNLNVNTMESNINRIVNQSMLDKERGL